MASQVNEREAKSPKKKFGHADAAVQTSQPEPDPLPVDRKRKRNNEKVNHHVINSTESWKEVLNNVDGEDADMYRRFLKKHDPNFNQHRFKTDKCYMIRTFFRMQPVVALQRCRRIARMLRRSFSSQETISLKDFAMKLGLQSISDQELDKQKRYKMRRRVEKSLESSVSEMDKENSLSGERSQERINRQHNKTGDVERNEKKRMVDAVQRNIQKIAVSERVLETPESDASNAELVKGPKFFNKQKTNLQSEPTSKSQPVKSGRPGFREYSSLEDHAIVSWISNGNRDRRVNGNTVWRELQEQFVKIGGQERTWHSLRNRYLRYILPALGGSLALPQPLAKRLRAAAARGELKSRKQSIPYPFQEPRVQSAWAAKPRHKESYSPTPTLLIDHPQTPRHSKPSPRNNTSTPNKSKLTPKPKHSTPKSKHISPKKTPKRVQESNESEDSSSSLSSSTEDRRNQHGKLSSVTDSGARRQLRGAIQSTSANEQRVLRSSDANARENNANANERPRTRRLYNHNAGFN